MTTLPVFRVQPDVRAACRHDEAPGANVSLKRLVAAGADLAFRHVDTGFFLANAVKIADGGWVSIGVAAIMGLIMMTWVRGTRLLFEKTRKNEVPLELLADQMTKQPPSLVPGTGVFLTSAPDSAPTALRRANLSNVPSWCCTLPYDHRTL